MNDSPHNTAVIIGGGTMGRAVAAVFQTAAWNVHVIETSDPVRKTLAQKISVASHTIGAKGNEPNVIVHASLSSIDWESVDIVIECAPEDLALKQGIFKALEALCPAPAPITSNSSSFPISEIGKGLETMERMVGLHFFMPAHLVPAVEVVCGSQTNEETIQRVSTIMRTVGKKPIRVKRDVPGFLANRIQHALMREAIALVEEGFASAEDVDAAVRYGFGLRYLAAGPLLQKDLAGIDIHCAAATTMYPHLHNNREPSAYMRELVANGDVGVKAASLRGFYQWTPETAAAEEKRYEAALLKALRILADEEQEINSKTR